MPKGDNGVIGDADLDRVLAKIKKEEKALQEAVRAKSEAEGALKQILPQLEKSFGVKTLKEANELERLLESELEKAEKELVEGWEGYEKKYKERLGET